MSLFSRNISIDIDLVEGESGILLVKTRMVDLIHDIAVNLWVAREDHTIVNLEVDMVKVPVEACRQIYPVAKKLVGASIGRGFNRNVVIVLAGGGGCPNVMNLVLVGAPLAINASHMVDAAGRVIPRDGGRRHDNYLKGVCIAHPAS